MTVPFDVSNFPLSAAFYQSDPPLSYGGDSPCALRQLAFQRNRFVLAQM